MKITLLLGFLFVELIYKVSATNIVCYFLSTNGYVSVLPEKINPNLCSHINYAFVNVSKDGSLAYGNEEIDVNQNLYKRVAALKSKNPYLKVLFSIGGGDSTAMFTQVASDKSKRSNLANSAKKFLETYNFDGIDVDWEFPDPNQRDDFLNLISDLRRGLGSKWILTAALPSQPTNAYNCPEIFKLLDFANVMSYDFFGPWSKSTGQNSALFPSSKDSEYGKKYTNLANTALNWINAGANPNKMNMGVAFYGWQFTLTNPTAHGLHAPIIATKTTSATFTKICKEYTHWTKVWDDEQKNPYRYSGDQWIGYDDEKSIALKTQHILLKKYAGIMIWHLGADDINGECGGRTQTLLKDINDEIKKDNGKK
ncbi:unnamed protein product [Brassicogethes aeneus]|uniref:GH18 domain-containing protein n=1 Tax=Brassicogethes aeneus TaxID=1431903 RepID=A0A9P0AZI6_BRAAE|nr:unnamed protein product [Brassicogethes aeneus]